jgi:ferredoxin-type protein NapH
MKAYAEVGKDAIKVRGWWQAHKWLILRRLSQLGILGLFLLGPLAGVWVIKGNLSSSMILDTVPMTEPILMLQMLAAGFVPAGLALVGLLVVLALYLLIGGRAYCSWVCPLNPVTDAAHWLRERLGLRGGVKLSRQLRYWFLGLVALLSLVTGTLAYESLNPVSLTHRAIIFGAGSAWLLVLAIFLFDLLLVRHGWCGHLCPMGALYGLLGRVSLMRVRAEQRAACDDCMDCFAVCPEPQVIKPALKGAGQGIGPVIDEAQCTNCGRCIDVCGKSVFRFGDRFNNN